MVAIELGVSFGSDRRRLSVGNRREGQVPIRARRQSVHHATLCIAAYGFLIAERSAFPPRAETAPAAPFVIPKAKFLLELLIIALDPPSQFGDVAIRSIGC
jgi:hypothetical protein